MAVHLKGTFAVTKHACEYWRAQSKAGNRIDARIVNTVSGAGLWGNVGQSAYGAAKAAIANLTVVTAMEAQRYGVAVNAISPLAVTRISEDFFSGDRAADPALDPGPQLGRRGVAAVAGVVVADRTDPAHRRRTSSAASRVTPRHRAAITPKTAAALQFSEIGQAVSWLYGTSPRGLAGHVCAQRKRPTAQGMILRLLAENQRLKNVSGRSTNSNTTPSGERRNAMYRPSIFVPGSGHHTGSPRTSTESGSAASALSTLSTRRAHL